MMLYLHVLWITASILADHLDAPSSLHFLVHSTRLCAFGDCLLLMPPQPLTFSQASELMLMVRRGEAGEVPSLSMPHVHPA